MNYAYAGNRDLGSWVLEFLVEQGHRPLALFLTNEDDPHIQEMIRLSGLPEERIFRGPKGLKRARVLLEGFDLDYIFGIHYPYLIKQELLELPRHGFLNLHPAYLPFNRGWHTPSWAILEGTPTGATLHVMSKDLDRGDIIFQKEVHPSPADTADSLYQRLKRAEFETFREAFPSLRDFSFSRTCQSERVGTTHRRAELLDASVAELKLDASYELRDLLRRLRALTTNDVSEACYFVEKGRRYRVRVELFEDPNTPS